MIDHLFGILPRRAPAPPMSAGAPMSATGGPNAAARPAASARDTWTLDLRGDYAHRIPGGRLLNWSASLNHAPTGPRFTLGAQLGLGPSSAAPPPRPPPTPPHKAR